MSKASKAQLDSMHELLAEKFMDILKNGEEVVTKEGEVVRVKPTAAMFNQIRTFLKDNHVEVDATKSRRLDNLVASLPFSGDEDADPSVSTH